MATGLKLWFGVVASTCTILALWMLPPTTWEGFTRGASPEEVRYRQVTAELQLAHGVLMARRWADSLSALAVETAVGGLALGHPPAEPVTADGSREWRELVASGLQSLEPRDPAMILGMFFQDDRHGSLEGVLLPRFGLRPQTYVGVRDATPYCLIVYPERYTIDDRSLRLTRRLENCLMHAKYGMPGAAIAGWLEAGGFAFARDVRLAELDSMILLRREEAMPFGFNRPFQESAIATGCIAGKLPACTLAFTDPGGLGLLQPLVDQSEIAFIRAGPFTPYAQKSSAILAELEAEYGPEVFRRFWKSEDEVGEAFQAAFGVDAGTWMRDWVQSEVGSYRSGPLPTRGALSTSLLTLMALSGIACAIAMRRRAA